MVIHRKAHLIILIAGPLMVYLASERLFAQGLPTINTPANNTVVHPGESFTVTVSIPTNPKPLSVDIGFEDSGFGLLPSLTNPPYSWNVTVNTTRFGLKQLTALVATGADQGVTSNPVTIDVEPLEMPVSLTVSPGRIGFFFVGESRPLYVSGTFSDLGVGDLTRSTHITYTSSSPAVANIAATGVVTANGPGSASIVVAYDGGDQQTVTVSVPNSTKGDLNGDGQVDIDDVNILDLYLNTQTNGPNDARDLNHDGKIDALDARILTTLCTYQRCATHQ